MPGSIGRLSLAALLLCSVPASADTIDLDLSAAIARAHRAAPDALAARARVAQADAAVSGARVTFTSNPEIEASAGPRLSSDHALDADLSIAQSLEPWRRGARRGLAKAQLAHAEAETGASLRELDLAVSLAFYDALFAREAAALAARSEELAAAAADAAQRRRKAGEITDLELDLARVSLGRARSATQVALADRAAALGRLAVLVGASSTDTLALRGTLEPPPLPPAVDATRRADVVALDRERELATAEQAQAVASGRPDLGLFVAYRREDTADILLGGLRFTLPVWNRAKGDKAAARAHEHAAGEARDAAVRAAEREVADAMSAYDASRRAVDLFERDVVPLLDDSEQLLQKSIDAGQLAISDYLVARQEIAAGRREHLERELALAKAAVAVRYASGGQP